MLRKTLAFCILISIAAIASADTFATSYEVDPTKKKGAGPPFRISRGKLWGYMDRTGKVIIQPRFGSGRDFFHGRAAVLKNNKWGYINEQGEAVIPFSFDGALDFTGEIAPVLVGRKWGYIDLSGRWIVSPQFQAAGEVSNGLARVVIDNKTGYIDKNGRMVIAPQFGIGWNFSEGLASIYDDHNNEYGYIDQAGKIVLRLGRTRWGFSDGLTIVGEFPNRVYMAKQGKVLAPYEVGYP